MRNIGLISAIAAALTTGRPMNIIYSGFDQGGQQPKAAARMAPIDNGPVVDSTKESKRARRRRLAKEGRHNG